MEKNIIYFYLIIFLSFIIIRAQLIWNFEVIDIEENIRNTKTNTNTNLRSTFEIPTQMDDKYHLTLINACLGTPPQCFNFLIHTDTLNMIVQGSNSNEKVPSDNFFYYTKSTTVQRNNKYIQIPFFGIKVMSFRAKDILSINGKDYSKIEFNIIENQIPIPLFFEKNIIGLLGLGYTHNQKEKELSIIETF